MTNPVSESTVDDVGNIVLLEHINLAVPDFGLAKLFYIDALGLTIDPFIDLGPELMWINVGRQQVHLPLGNAQILRGQISLVIPDLTLLLGRLESMARYLSNTEFSFSVVDGAVDVSCPWGNRFHCRVAAPGERTQLGMPSIAFDVGRGSVETIAHFYREMLGAIVSVESGMCRVRSGVEQSIVFRETSDQLPAYDGHHLAIYVPHFSRSRASLADRDLVVADDVPNEFRFAAIVDPETGQPVYEIEHEVRSLQHRLYQRPLVNRNAEQTLLDYVPGDDAFSPRRGDAHEGWDARASTLTTIG